MSDDEDRREIERRSKEGDPAARRSLLQVRLREEGAGAFVMDFVKGMLEAGPVTVSIPYRDACGALVRYVGEAGHRGSWRCPVCGCAYPYTFWDMKSDGPARVRTPDEVVLGLDEDACPSCGEIAGDEGSAEGAEAKPGGEAPSLKPHLESMSGTTGAKASRSPSTECRCQRKRRVLGEELEALKAKATAWRNDIAFLGRVAREAKESGRAEEAARDLELLLSAESDLVKFEARAEELRQELRVDKETDP